MQAAVAAQAVRRRSRGGGTVALPSAAPGGATESEDACTGGVSDGTGAAAGHGDGRELQEATRGRGGGGS